MSVLPSPKRVIPRRRGRRHDQDSGPRHFRPRHFGPPPRVGRRAITLCLLFVLVLTLLAAVPGLRGVLRTIRGINPIWIVAAVALELASDISFVVLFRLFFDRLPGREARLLGWTEQASGALLPGGGAGGLAIGGWLIHLTGVPTDWIICRSSGLFFLTSAVNGATLVGSGVALIVGAPGPRGFALVLLPTLLATAAVLVVLAAPRIAGSLKRCPRWLDGVATGVRDAETTTFKPPSWRLVGAFGYLLFDMAVLWVCLHGLGGAPSIPALILAYNIGYLANTIPIPGGIGALDAGLAGALSLYGVSPTHAAAAVIVYHAIALWVPGLGGVLAFLRLRPRLIQAADAGSSSSDPANPRLRRHTMNTLAAMLKPIEHGWAVTLSDGRELARFTGLAAKQRALRYLSTHDLAQEASHAA